MCNIHFSGIRQLRPGAGMPAMDPTAFAATIQQTGKEFHIKVDSVTHTEADPNLVADDRMVIQLSERSCRGDMDAFKDRLIRMFEPQGYDVQFQ